jgi:uncharacterized membrane protein YcfT
VLHREIGGALGVGVADSLGHLLEVILIVVAMMIAGQLMQTIYDRLGVDADDAPTESS